MTNFRLKLFAATLCFQPALVLAHLGGDQSTIEKDRARLNAVTPSQKKSETKSATDSAAPAYTIHEIESGAHTIREYLNPTTGVVFAVAWNGNAHPDLEQLLGTYATEHQAAFKTYRDDPNNRKKKQRNHSIKSANIIVERGGHMRNFKGRAYISAMIPAGVKIDEIK